MKRIISAQDAEIERLKQDNKSFFEKVTAQDAEIKRLNEVLQDMDDHGCAAERMEYIKRQSDEIEWLKALCSRAADALENKQWNMVGQEDLNLIAELRKAAE